MQISVFAARSRYKDYRRVVVIGKRVFNVFGILAPRHFVYLARSALAVIGLSPYITGTLAYVIEIPQFLIDFEISSECRFKRSRGVFTSLRNGIDMSRTGTRFHDIHRRMAETAYFALFRKRQRTAAFKIIVPQHDHSFRSGFSGHYFIFDKEALAVGVGPIGLEAHAFGGSYRFRGIDSENHVDRRGTVFDRYERSYYHCD